MARWYLHPVGDGTFYPVYQDDSGNFHKLSQTPLPQAEAEAVAANHERSSGGGQTQPSGSTQQPGSSTGGSYSTPNGQKTIQNMRDELRAAGGPVDSWSDQQIYDEYIKLSTAATSGGAGAGAGAGGVIAGGDTNGAEDAAWRIAQMVADRQKTSGWMQDPEEAALDYIWEMGNREGDYFQNFKQFFEERGWDVSTPQGQRDAVRRWLTFANDGKNAVDVAKGWGFDFKPTPTLDRETGWAQILGSLTGPRDWVKYARMLQGMPDGSLGPNGKYFQSTSPWGEVSRQPSWGDALSDNLAQNPMGGANPTANREQMLYAQPMPDGYRDMDPNYVGINPPRIPDGGSTYPNHVIDSPTYGINPPNVPDGGSTYPNRVIDSPFSAASGRAPYYTPDSGGADINDLLPKLRDAVSGMGTGSQTWQPAGPGKDAYDASGVLQPHKINIKDFNNWDPSTREMQAGMWEDQGQHADDMWSRMRKAAPQGWAASTTSWR